MPSSDDDDDDDDDVPPPVVADPIYVRLNSRGRTAGAFYSWWYLPRNAISISLIQIIIGRSLKVQA